MSVKATKGKKTKPSQPNSVSVIHDQQPVWCFVFPLVNQLYFNITQMRDPTIFTVFRAIYF